MMLRRLGDVMRNPFAEQTVEDLKRYVDLLAGKIEALEKQVAVLQKRKVGPAVFPTRSSMTTDWPNGGMNERDQLRELVKDYQRLRQLITDIEAEANTVGGFHDLSVQLAKGERIKKLIALYREEGK